ncbi:lipopolysaccharide biosynthesis protein [Parabacteroides sp. OttesenSCG-928-G21]|nr:lipopolysaccharide biosynthesis protein [Parabacteroides sp. OttesenSCG-928-G21]
MNTLKEKAIHGTKWAMIDSFLNISVSFVISLILARLLTPNDYGLIGMTNILIVILNVFVSSGLGSSLIRTRNISQKDYSTIFFFNIVICIVAYIILFGLAPFVAQIYDQPILKKTTRVLGLSLIINGLSIVQSSIRTKQINFKIQAKITIVGTVSGGIFGIILAYNEFGVWSIVGQTILRSTIVTSLFWLTSEWRPIWYFSKKIFQRHFSYSINILKSNLAIAIIDNFYYLIIGKFYSAATLGQYTRAETFVNLFTKNIQMLAHTVGFPTLCSINNDKEAVKIVFKKIMTSLSFFSCLCIFMFVAISDNFIPFTIGEQWNTSIIYLKILSIGAFFYPIKSQNIQLVNVFGRSDIYKKAVVFQRILTIVFAVIGIFTNILVLVWGYSIVNICSYFYNSIQVKRIIKISIREQIYQIIKVNWITILISLLIFLIGVNLNFGHGINLLIQLLIAFFLSITIFEKTKHEIYMYSKKIILSELSKIIKKQ